MIRFHTGYNISHVEVYLGNGESIASRDGKGVGIYPQRTSKLAYVLRSASPFSVEAARKWYREVGFNQPYGWADLLQFCGYNVNGKGMVCSPCATYVLRAATPPPPIFGARPAETIKPGDFLLVPERLRIVWADDDTPVEVV